MAVSKHSVKDISTGQEKEYQQYATIWKDTKLTGVRSNWFKGKGREFSVIRRLRRLKGKSAKVQAFEAIIWYVLRSPIGSHGYFRLIA